MSESVSQWVTDMCRLWSDLGPIKKNCTVRSEALPFHELTKNWCIWWKICKIYKTTFTKYANLKNMQSCQTLKCLVKDVFPTKTTTQTREVENSVYLEYCLISLHFVSKRIFPSWQNHSMRACWRACKSRPKKELSSVTLLKSTPSCVPRCSGMWFSFKRCK